MKIKLQHIYVNTITTQRIELLSVQQGKLTRQTLIYRAILWRFYVSSSFLQSVLPITVTDIRIAKYTSADVLVTMIVDVR